ncbi:hypothetical protein GLAREA_01164 [Glarea lozoyensis ATCC 20868]|uniref:Heterokaryon incompatibility domain-containing protein n=1 Tax=Glarea lozoyensis (strain ATCC 20868 / MF5171) TaxID=1116229 RepID=S3CYH5_GLAL2|nr:uncharacterized protein GLAREA_01164 [Glarea lozoyensis ATCC 20868]EPE30004.1 hypothetical protein GLAREA_01164 [Glarea lozoyensis ATCC 20868]
MGDSSSKTTAQKTSFSPFRYSSRLCHRGCREIRLITITPYDPEFTTAHFEIKLLEFDVDQAPAYQALSYCWGGQQPSIGVICNDLLLLITTNLFQALWMLSLNMSEPTFLWVDAICINQSDDDEKNIQVGLMRDIYATARKVHVWLGLDSTGEDVKEAMRFLTLVHEVVKDTNYDFDEKRDDREALRRMLPWTLIRNMDHYRHLNYLLKLPWFSRVWIVQEVAVCQDALVYCGSSEIPWSKLVLALRVLYRLELLLQMTLYTPEDPTGEKLIYLGHFLCTCSSDKDQMPKPGLFGMLVRHRWALATDPRDKVYGLLGLLDEDSSLGLKPEYGLDVADIFLQVATSILKGSYFLDLLSVPQNLGSKINLPSWVPDWSHGPSSFLLLRLMHPKDFYFHFKSSGATNSKGNFKIHGHVLEVQGWPFDTVEEIGPEILQSPGRLEEGFVGLFARIFLNFYTYLDTFHEWHRISHCGHHPTYPNGENRLDVFLQALFQDDAEEEISIASLRYHFWLLKVTRGWFSCLQQTHLQYYPKLYIPLLLVGTVVYWVFSLLYHRRIFEPSSGYFQGNVFCRTEKSYIGAVPPATTVGDSIMLITGSRVPLVFRRVGSNWRLVGLAYVPGLMVGEEWDEEKCRPITII